MAPKVDMAAVQLAAWTAWVDRAIDRDDAAELARKAEWLINQDVTQPDLQHLGVVAQCALIDRLSNAAKRGA